MLNHKSIALSSNSIKVFALGGYLYFYQDGGKNSAK
jgi:hypothetical protein